MNGHTDIDPINPCSQAVDRHTYGCCMLNICFYGQRLVRVGMWRFAVDVYWSPRRKGWTWFFVGRCSNAATWFTPFGCVTWPMPDQLKRMKRPADTQAGEEE